MASSVVYVNGSIRRGRLELFDGFRLEVDGDRVHPTLGAQRLLAYLTLQGPSPRAVVAGTLWGDVPEERALGSLRTTVWRINQAVPGLVAAEHRQLALAGFVSVDVAEFADRATARFRHPGDAEQPSPELRARELLPGWYEDWVVFERERLRQLHLHVLEAVALQLCAGAQYAVALDTALAAVRIEPLRESARSAVIRVHLAEGNVTEALREYHRFRRLLAGQLGVEPSAGLRALVAEWDCRRGPASDGPVVGSVDRSRA